MIEYIVGKLVDLSPTNAVVETAGGVAYNLCISLYDFEELQGKETAKLLVFENIREDAWTLYGFVNDRERQLFKELIGVSGVGAASARIILSSIPGPELQQIIVSGDEKRLKAVKGIGQKTAQRIIVDLKDKIKLSEDTFIEQTLPMSQSFEEALAALVMLGFQKQASQKVLKKLFDDDPHIKVEKAIKAALTML